MVRVGLRPSRTPFATARLRPSPVRARINSRSNSASPPKTVSITVTTSPLSSWSITRRARLVCAPAGLLAVDFGATFGAELLELSVERLPVGADAGVSEVAILRASFDHIFCLKTLRQDRQLRVGSRHWRKPLE